MFYIPSDIMIGSLHKSLSYGEFCIVSYRGHSDVTIRFTLTGTVENVESRAIRSGKVKDFMYPSNYGHGMFGYGPFNSRKDKGAYKCWSEMLKRCYSDSYQRKKPTYSGCRVCDEWLVFQVFAKWYYENHPQDGGSYHLDKDIKIDGNKTYKPESCMFVSPAENVEKSWELRRSVCKLMSPDGNIYDVLNQAKFCREHGIDSRAINAVVKGKRNHHKGWTKA